MADGQTDPSRLQGEALRHWYLRSPDDIEQERQDRQAQSYDDFFGGLRRPASSFAAQASKQNIAPGLAIAPDRAVDDTAPQFHWVQAGANRWRSLSSPPPRPTSTPRPASTIGEPYVLQSSASSVSAPANGSERINGSAAQTAPPPNQGVTGTPAGKSRRSVGHPGFAESLVPIWGSGREAVADFQEGNYAGAALNGALAASDLFLAESIAKGLAKGGFYVAKNVAKKAPYDWDKVVRPWMGKQGFLESGQHGHHWAIPQNGWGKNVPDIIKNQPWNIKPMPDAVTHWRLEHRVGEIPRFNPAERIWHGTPAWAKVGATAAIGHPAAAAKARSDDHE